MINNTSLAIYLIPYKFLNLKPTRGTQSGLESYSTCAIAVLFYNEKNLKKSVTLYHESYALIV